MSRWEHRDEIRRSYQEYETGRYRYTGLWLTIPMRRERLRRCRLWYLAQIAATLALVIGMGLVHAGPMQSGRGEGFNYVVLLYDVVLLLGAAAGYYAWRVCSAGFRLPMHDSRYADRHGDFSAACMAAAWVLAAAQAVYTLTAGAAENRVGDWLLAGLALLLGGVSCAAWRLQKRMGWVTVEDKPD